MSFLTDATSCMKSESRQGGERRREPLGEGALNDREGAKDKKTHFLPDRSDRISWIHGIRYRNRSGD